MKAITLLLILITSTFFSASTISAEVSNGTSLEEKFIKISKEPNSVFFTPPTGWRMVPEKELPPNVFIMVIGKGKREYPPSINLGIENYKGTVKGYLGIIKDINESQGAEYRDLGIVQTAAGNAQLVQIDMKTEWGPVRLMHAVLIYSGRAYVLTSAALKEEFASFYRDFFLAMNSLHINKNLLDCIESPKQRAAYEEEYHKLQENWQRLSKQKSSSQENLSSKEIFDSDEFQKKYWKPFENFLESNFPNQSSEWKTQLLTQTKKQLEI